MEHDFLLDKCTLEEAGAPAAFGAEPAPKEAGSLRRGTFHWTAGRASFFQNEREAGAIEEEELQFSAANYKFSECLSITVTVRGIGNWAKRGVATSARCTE